MLPSLSCSNVKLTVIRASLPWFGRSYQTSNPTPAEPLRVRGLKLGADDVVTCPFQLVELCARVSAICRDGPGEVVCDATALTAPTLGTVHALARAALTARRLGVPFRVRPSPALHGLLALVGLGEPLPGGAAPVPICEPGLRHTGHGA